MAGYEAIVVGSGFGGAVAACRLAEAGQSVLVLERGRRWDRTSFPREATDDWVFDVDDPFSQHGWIDLRVFPRIAVVQGAGVGGGSLIYANVSVPAEPVAFASGWPAEITFTELAPDFERSGRMLDVQPLPEGQMTRRASLVREAAVATGAAQRVRALPLAVRFDPNWSYDLPDPHGEQHAKFEQNAFGRRQGTCIHCGNCDLGCPVGARNTLDLNYLARAEDKGADIRPLLLVEAIRPDGTGYRVDYRSLETGSVGFARAAKVIVAAGSLGSTELLLRCRDEHKTLPNLSPRLGYGWCANGDFLTPALYFDRAVSPTRGPTITTAIDYLDGSDGGHRYFVEDGGFPDVIGNAVRAAFGRSTLGRQVLESWRMTLGAMLGGHDPLRTVMPWFGQGIDANDGVMRLERPLFGRGLQLSLDYSAAGSRGVVQAMVDRHQTLARATGGTPLVSPAWTWFQYLITPHPLGGCNMGTSPNNGVVDHAGEVFGYPNLYVMDGAIVPRALGLNPSRTIAALAERCMRLMLASD